MKPRQFAAVTYKNWILLMQSYCGMVCCLIVAIAIMVLLGLLHEFYVSNYDPINNNASAMNPIQMPIESSPANINHHMHFTLMPSVDPRAVRNFGEMPENGSIVPNSGFLSKANMQWSKTGSPQLRMDWKIPVNTTCNYTKITIPFATIDDMSCTDVNCTKFKSWKELDKYQNETTYELMRMDIAAEHNKPNTTNTSKMSFTEKLAESILRVFKPDVASQEEVITAADIKINETNEFLYHKHSALFTTAVNYTYLNYPVGGFFGHKVSDAGWDYTISTYTSH